MHKISQSSNAELEFTVNNNYFTHFTAKPFLTLSPLFGKSNQVLIEEKHVLPGKNRIWRINRELKGWNFYTAHLAVSVGNGEQIFKDAWFIILPVPLKQIIIFIIVLALIWLVVFKKDRLKKGFKILMSK